MNEKAIQPPSKPLLDRRKPCLKDHAPPRSKRGVTRGHRRDPGCKRSPSRKPAAWTQQQGHLDRSRPTTRGECLQASGQTAVDTTAQIGNRCLAAPGTCAVRTDAPDGAGSNTAERCGSIPSVPDMTAEPDKNPGRSAAFSIYLVCLTTMKIGVL